jgi:hypothetical protein
MRSSATSVSLTSLGGGARSTFSRTTSLDQWLRGPPAITPIAQPVEQSGAPQVPSSVSGYRLAVVAERGEEIVR